MFKRGLLLVSVLFITSIFATGFEILHYKIVAHPYADDPEDLGAYNF